MNLLGIDRSINLGLGEQTGAGLSLGFVHSTSRGAGECPNRLGFGIDPDYGQQMKTILRTNIIKESVFESWADSRSELRPISEGWSESWHWARSHAMSWGACPWSVSWAEDWI